jgi:protein-disulfide isomerase
MAVAAVGLAAVAASALLVASATAEEQSAREIPEVVARVGGQALSREALLSEAAASLAQVEEQRLRCETEAERNEQTALEGAVERLVKKKQFTLEAERRGVTEEALREEIRAKAAEVSDADIDTFYTENQSRIRQSRVEIGEQIRDYLRQQRLEEAEKAFFATLEDTFEVDVLLEPMRVAVAVDGHPSRGPETAPVTIVEFSDFECPYCKRVVPTLDQVEEKYGEQVRVVYRHYPLSSHPNAQKAAEASLCARDQGKFWEMHDLMFEEQRNLAEADLKEKAARLELDAAAFADCLDSDRHAEAVQSDMRDGSLAGVDGTPAFFVNGRFLSGAVPFETLAALIDDEIRRKKRG